MAQQQSTTDRWGNPLPRKLALKSGKVVAERFYDRAQYHDNCRCCGGDTYGTAIWYVRKDEANVAPKHAECPTDPTPYAKAQRPDYVSAVKSQSVYAQRRENRVGEPRQGVYRPQFYESGGLIWEDE